MKWHGLLWRVAVIVGVAVVLGFLEPTVPHSDSDLLGGHVYKNLATVNIPCAQDRLGYAAGAPCVRPAGFTDKFRIFPFLLALIILTGMFGATEYIPREYKKDDPIFGRFIKKASSLGLLRLQSPSKAFLFSACCWLIGLPLNFYLLGAPFWEYTQLCFIVALFGYLVGMIFVILAGLADKSSIKLTRSSSPFEVNLTGLEASKVVDVMGIPIKVISFESKMIYVYKNIRVIFTDGQVTGVQ